ncbi:G patch domain-containing protein 1 homolog [Danaus plexippus]|uniref:G patch domain-containing protein 1 homolog n=1 Tax=Danaus plexippus TaxID=13037 RepID=UPI002AB14D3C|nr:G patch domain-containing protein 1 homolog [Danaus plexippus]
MSGSDSEEENTLRYGTPLEPYEEDELPSKKKYQPQEQYAVDEHGKRRFHGAFTGGFSAGFGNSVGTPEGWTPSSFKSSRAEKAQIANQRPEDFMDEEDRSEFGIAPRSLQANQEFTGQKRTRTSYYDGTIPGVPVLEQLLRPVHETTAVKILRKMGWRDGQGVGDRVTRTEKKKTSKQHKVYGCYMPDDMRQVSRESDSSESEFEYEQLFAPDDYEPYVLKNKNDKFGLGYEGLSRHSVLGNMVGEYDAGGSKSHLLMRDKGRKVSIRGQAFGVGAFEADDEDIYSREDMTHYDYEMGPEVTTKKHVAKQQNNVLQGFVKSKAKPPSVASYPPPTLPRGYVPATRRSRFDESRPPQRDQGLGRHELTSAARGALLGETPVDSAEHTQRKEPGPQAASDTKMVEVVTDMTVPPDARELNYISIKNTDKSNLKVFKPFASDPQKQLRYERYLEMKPEREGASDRLTQWERDREMAEFEQAAKLYKPLSGVMGDRFTRASEPDDALNPLCAVAKSSINYGLASPEMIEAAKKGAYGVMTRKEVSWRPETLVCKRFNVPEIGARLEESKEDKPKVSYSIFSYMESSVHSRESFTQEQSKFSGSKSLNMEHKAKKPDKDEEKQENINKDKEINTSKRLTVAELFIRESEKDLNGRDKEVAQTIEKFDKIDLYKSIFLSDSEDEGTDKNDPADTNRNMERNNSPARGIFANIDFDELNAWRRNADRRTDRDTGSKDTDSKDTGSKDTDSKGGTKEVEDKHEENVSELMYGPKIPENLQKRLEVPAKDNFKPVYRSKDKRDESSSSSESWVEAGAKQKKEKKKKSKKHKSKHKKKHKKRDR